MTEKEFQQSLLSEINAHAMRVAAVQDLKHTWEQSFGKLAHDTDWFQFAVHVYTEARKEPK